ncbi:MAG: 4-alpha-glucanotransferase [Gammaproteobacteria bacterium]|nr:4-alpha-glucanotransferase [Gammaproteobacteria bacterium]
MFDVQTRSAGVLLHPTSLPSGVLGVDAYRFVDFLAEAGFSLWQVLPLGPPHGDRSPYQSMSVHAGDPALIDWQYAVSRSWLTDAESRSVADERKYFAAQGFGRQATESDKRAYREFCQTQSSWLDDYSLFRALKLHYNGVSWCDWPKPLRDRDASALQQWASQLAKEVEAFRFEQFVFFTQWQGIRDYARQKGVGLFGDMPIFVAHDSADVWGNPEIFRLDERGQPTVVAGVPPDYFSATGQRWGNPLYNWDVLAQQNFAWWNQRMATQLGLFDVIRIDHFRGFEAYWEIAAEEKTAINGHWELGPGAAFFEALQNKFGEQLPLVAEDLGVITEQVEALREAFHLPGMKILQFAFGGGADNPYLPHNHAQNSVVYTGTHDNNTTLGWWQEQPASVRQHVCDYLMCNESAMPVALVRSALASRSRWCVLPLQDLLMLDGQHRMNVPGTEKGNWSWRFAWDQFQPELATQCRQWLGLYGRLLPR